MKKRIFVLLMVLCMLLCACSKADKPEDNGNAADGAAVSNSGEAANDAADAGSDNDDTADAENSKGDLEDGTSNTDAEVPFEGKYVTFDTSVTHQTMDGFGAAYTWYGDRLLNAKDSEAGLDALFSDAKLTILRFKNEYEYTMPGKANNANAMLRNYREARNRAGQYGETVQILLCCWSPPAYLKSDNTLNTGYGTLKKDENGSYMYKEYADWWTESVKYYRSKGIQIDYVSIQNEVDFSPESYEGCRFDAKENDEHAGYAQAFCAVYDAFNEAFGDDAPILLGPETMSCTTSSMISYTTEISKINPEALGGLAFHLYVGGTSDSSTLTVKPSSYYVPFSGMESSFPDIRKWETEFYIGQGIQTSELIWSALTNAEMTAYLYWSGVWDDSTPNQFESADLIEINNKGEWRTSSNYYAMRHYSQFIRPGYVRIDAESDEARIKVSAFANSNNTKVAAVLVNNSDKEYDVKLAGTDYTVLGFAAYQSVFGQSAQSDENMFKPLGELKDGIVTLPAYSVTSVDITGYAGNTPAEVPEVKVITYEDHDEEIEEIPDYDVVILDSDFSEDSQVSKYSGFGSSITRRIADGGEDKTGCMIVKGRADAWNGMTLDAGYFENYGYLVKVSYDVMMEESGSTVSCTSTFSVDSGTYYPDGENNRIAVFDMEGGKWYHAEGYATMYGNMNPESFRLYWESPDNTNDFYLDNIKVTIMYTMPAGDYSVE